MKRISKTTLNLKQFVLRQEVLKLYRDILRTIRMVPDANSQQELKFWARQDFRKNLHEKDVGAIKILIQYGRRSLNELEQSLQLSGVCEKYKK